MTFRSLIKLGLANLLYYSGVLEAFARVKLVNRGFVLMYHRVINELDPSACAIMPGMYVSKASFEKQMVFLRDHFQFVSLEEMIRIVAGGGDLTRCCCITFDDGWRDNYDVAFPILKRHGIPATIFLATEFVGSERLFWPDEVLYCFSLLSERNMLDEFLDNVGSVTPKTGDINLSIHSFIERLKKLHPDEREDIMTRIRSRCPEKPKERLMMNWSEAEAMLQSGLITFGSHTASHALLHQLEPKAIDLEIETSRHDIQRNLSIDANLFAYPNGDYNDAAKSVLNDHGFIGAVTTKRGYVSTFIPRMEIPRIGMHNDVSRTLPLFYARILLNIF